MFRDHVVGQKTRLTCDGEHQIEVIGLPRVHDVDDPVGMQVPYPVPDRRQVRCRVAKTTVALPYDHGGGEAVDKDAQRAVIDYRSTVAFQLGDERWKII